MTMLKQLTLTASFAACGLFLVEPARALSPITQPYFASPENATAAQPVKQRRQCYAYRDGRRVYRPCPPRRHQAKRQTGRFGTSQNSGYYKPWTGIQLCENCPAFK